MSNERNQTPGKVIIAGAGPGDAELITIKLQKRLAEADVIFVDRLVNPEITDLYARPDALVLMTGKQGYHDGSVAQEDINKLLVGHAQNGKTVLRLKGGDVAFFSNVLDELQSLSEANIPFEIIPGITAASGASAYAGIPLTARGYAKAVQFITFNPCSFYTREQWKAWASSSDTLVFYMAARNLEGLAELFLRHTKKPHTALAVIEQATTEHQRVHVSTLTNVKSDFAAVQFSSPSLVIIGDVVKLHEQFDWYAANKTGSVFNELVTVK
ncbi:uroporphyrinogen-III C-methyltransferase [Lacibacter luteus]|uniref:uroporphyrinogen-III C-methyltransferase n=1 Tax=Lacibacter luteus TaxID=2508719 RepID=A0A4Q1CPE5_9BACT|nr:uroporphyrinogen-III C-methyltransferase [Lacibacter luteus]RXK62519.1 uroporphyrinogen-III C-methyltransferase [Lacibacter luteus]